MSRTLHSKAYANLIAWLKSGRLKAGLSMRELSEKLGVTHSYIGKVEQNERRLDVLEYVKYCEALGLNPEEGLKIIQRKR